MRDTGNSIQRQQMCWGLPQHASHGTDAGSSEARETQVLAPSPAGVVNSEAGVQGQRLSHSPIPDILIRSVTLSVPQRKCSAFNHLLFVRSLSSRSSKHLQCINFLNHSLALPPLRAGKLGRGRIILCFSSGN